MRSPLYSQRTLAGTLAYVSPEIILGQPYGRAVDIWVSIESPLQWLNAGSGFGGFVLRIRVRRRALWCRPGSGGEM
jgi:serine/threonine protein kinase